MTSKDYSKTVGERAEFVGYQFCVVFLRPYERGQELVESFTSFLHVHNGHVPQDKVFDIGSGLYLAVMEGSSDSFRSTRSLPRNTEVRSVDSLVAKFLSAEARSGKPVDVSIGIAEYQGDPKILYQLAAFSQQQWTVIDGELVSKSPMPVRRVAEEAFSQAG